MTPSSVSESSSLESINVATNMTKRHESMLPPEKEERLFRSPKEMINDLLQQVEQTELRHAMRVEIKRLLTDHERLVSMLQQRSELLEHENDELRHASQEHQRRYEKAVREMQFFKRKYEHHRQQQEEQRPRRSLSIDSRTSSEQQQQQQQPSHATSTAGVGAFPLTPTSPQPIPEEPQDPSSSTTATTTTTTNNNNNKTASITLFCPPPYDAAELARMAKSPIPGPATLPSCVDHPQRAFGDAPQRTFGDVPPYQPAVVYRVRQNSTAASVHSTQSSSTEGANTIASQGTKSTVSTVSSVPSSASSASSSSSSSSAGGDKARKKQSWQQQQQPVNLPTPSTTTNTTTTMSPNTVHSVPMTPVRSSTATNGYTGASLIQQRRVDPLIFGGSDGLWDTIAKSKGSDATVEKIISNFLRRGGSPNTSKQSGSANAVKYGYGMIHALIVTKAPGSLDLLLQQGANPNVMTLSQIEDDKVTPCYLAAEVGWLTGLQKLVQAGGDLVAARGAGIKNKTALHVAAEHCHAAVVEYIVNVTQGALNLEEDSQGATVLHYACASGHTDLVSFLARSCQIPVNQPDHRGELPLHWAARHGRLEVVTLLVERCGCDVNAYVPRKVGTPLDLAKAGSQRRLVDYLKGLGALTGKKMDRRREEENENEGYLENKFAKNGFAGFFVGGEEDVDFF